MNNLTLDTAIEKLEVAILRPLIAYSPTSFW